MHLVLPLLALLALPGPAGAQTAPPAGPAVATPAVATEAERDPRIELAGLAPEALAVQTHPATAESPVAVGIWPGQPYQGALLVVDVAAPAAITSATGTFLGNELTWHRLDDRTWRGMGPVPNGAQVGPADLELQVKTTVGGKARTVKRRLPLQVQPLAFGTDELTVDSRFTRLSPAATRKIAKDRKLLKAMWKKGSNPEPLSTGRFVIPRDDRTTAPYGVRRTYNGQIRSVHEGWDIDGDVGDEIRSPNAGVVTMASDLYYSGGTLFVDHGGGLYTAYFHMTEFAVKPGDRVEKGQLLGTVGRSGRVTGPHLHWAAKIGGHYIHPASLLLFDFGRAMVQSPADGPEVVPAVGSR